MLVVVPVIEQHRARKSRVQLLRGILYRTGKAQIPAVFRHIAETSVVAAGDYHELRRIPAVYLRDRRRPHPSAGDGVPVDIQDHLYGGVFLQRRPDRCFASVIGSGVAGVVVNSPVMQHRDTVIRQLLRQGFADPYHVVLGIPGAARVAAVVICTLIRLVAFRRVRVDYKHLRLRRIPLYRKLRRSGPGGEDTVCGIRRAVPHKPSAGQLYVVVPLISAETLPDYHAALGALCRAVNSVAEIQNIPGNHPGGILLRRAVLSGFRGFLCRLICFRKGSGFQGLSCMVGGGFLR